MKKRVLPAVCSMLLSAAVAPAQALTLNFSSGNYNSNNTSYQESGVTVDASDVFYGLRLGTLAWYNGDNVIRISSSSNLFDLDRLTIVDRAFAGLVFQSSKGGQVTVGSVSGSLSFVGEEWHSLSYFTVTSVTHADVLNEIDDVVLSSVTPVPESGSLWLMLLGLAAIAARARKNPSPAMD